MKRTTLLYGVFIVAALIAGILVPFAIHEQGSRAVPGWQGLVNPGPMSRAHQTFGQKCESCHTPHKGIEAKNCLACHKGTEFGDKASTRFHATASKCTSCHLEHDGGQSLTRMNHDALLDAELWKPTAAGGPGKLPVGAKGQTTASLDCASCHSARDPHQGLFGPQCSSCHVLTAWSLPRFRHPPPSSRQCAECHKPPPSHSMGHFEMVSQRVAGRRARVDQCYACHTTDSWNNIRRKGVVDHH